MHVRTGQLDIAQAGYLEGTLDGCNGPTLLELLELFDHNRGLWHA